MSINLEAERVNLGLTAKAAAAQIGIAGHILRYSETTGRPRPETAKQIADWLGQQYDPPREIKVTDIWPLDDAASQPESQEQAA